MKSTPHPSAWSRSAPHRSSVAKLPVVPVQWRISLLTWLGWAVVCALAMTWSPAHAQDLRAEISTLVQTQVRQIGEQLGPDAARGAPPRVEIKLGDLDPRLKLAPCEKVRAYMPEGSRLWGRARVGMRCEQGPVRWNVYWPVEVKVWAPAVVAVVPLRPGVAISASDVRIAEADLASGLSPAFRRVEEVIGRSVMRVIDPGESVHQDDLRQRRWFAAGDTVTVKVKGVGFSASADGLAISHGDEGQCARIKFESGRVVCGRPVGERMAEVLL